jgi:hypothetical protein
MSWLSFFSRKPKVCFFCKTDLKESSTFTLQYSSAEGLHSEKMCSECAKTFDEFADIKDEARASRFDSL